MKNLYLWVKHLTFFCLILNSTKSFTQTYGIQIVGGAKMVVQSGTTLTLTGNLGLKTDGTGTNLANNGTVVIDGSFLNQNAAQVSGGDFKIGGSFANAATFQTTGIIELNSVNACSISSSTALNNIIVNKGAANPVVNLSGNLSINGTLAFLADNTFIQLNAYNLSISNQAISGFDNNNFVITNSTGTLIQNVSTTNKIYPIGTATTSYTPLSIAQTLTSNYFGVRLQDGVQAVVGNASNLTSGVVNKSWIVNEVGTPVTKNLSITCQWNGNNELTGFDANKCGISRWNSNTSAWDLTFSNIGVRSGLNPYTRSRSGITNIGTFSVMSINTTVIPLSLLDFKVHANNNTAFLVWQTSDERNLSHYGIEKSTNGQSWINIGQIKAAALNTYHANDDTAFMTSKTVFYRLHIVDLDGSFRYSPIRQVAATQKPSLQVFPNPAHHSITVQGIDVDEEWFITDAIGRVIAHFKGEKEVNLSNYTEGVYFIRTSKDRVAKFVKTN